MDFAWVGVAFWAWLAAVVIAEEMGNTKRRRVDLDLIRFAIEKGQPLSPDIVQLVFAKPAMSPIPLLISGIVAIAAGIGLIVFALFLAQNSPRSGRIVAGAGSIAICVGAGLAICYRLVRRSQPSVAKQ